MQAMYLISTDYLEDDFCLNCIHCKILASNATLSKVLKILAKNENPAKSCKKGVCNVSDLVKIFNSESARLD